MNSDTMQSPQDLEVATLQAGLAEAAHARSVESAGMALALERAEARADELQAELVQARDSARMYQEMWQRERRIRDEHEATIERLAEMLRDVTAVAIAMLYVTHREDLLAAFTIKELQEIASAGESLQPEQVEHIYRRGWELAMAGKHVEVPESGEARAGLSR